MDDFSAPDPAWEDNEVTRFAPRTWPCGSTTRTCGRTFGRRTSVTSADTRRGRSAVCGCRGVLVTTCASGSPAVNVGPLAARPVVQRLAPGLMIQTANPSRLRRGAHVMT